VVPLTSPWRERAGGRGGIDKKFEKKTQKIKFEARIS
jgi:hypothetical protein